MNLIEEWNKVYELLTDKQKIAVQLHFRREWEKNWCLSHAKGALANQREADRHRRKLAGQESWSKWIPEDRTEEGTSKYLWISVLCWEAAVRRGLVIE